MSKLRSIALVGAVLAGPAGAAETMEAVGAQKCGGAVRSYTIEFLAPETTQLVASATASVGGATDRRRATAKLSIDGKPCNRDECSFRANKGQTYTLSAESEVQASDELCISVSRP